jgi:preprotein translocase subunit YajC
MFWINDAIAAATTSATATTNGSQNSTIFLMVGFLAVFYFLMIRPQYKRAKDHRQLLSGLTEGDEVITNSGLFGRITKVMDDKVKLLIAKEVEVELQKAAVTHLVPKGTLTL